VHGFNSYAPVRAPSSPSRANACDHARMTRRGHACDIGCLPAAAVATATVAVVIPPGIATHGDGH